MPKTIDLITQAATRELRSFTRATGQPTDITLLDTSPMEHVQSIEIDEEHITIIYNERKTHHYNIDEITHKEWTYKYNDDPEFVRAIAGVIEASRKRLRTMPDNIACPPGCAQCCSGYEPFVNKVDVQRIANHLGLTYEQVLRDYIVQRESADGYVIGYLRKIKDDIAAQCVFLKGKESGHYYCGIYKARPHDCEAFTPIGCVDVDDTLSRNGSYADIVGAPFRPRHAKKSRKKH
jgi:Fe-S-cluster containining protein